MQHNIFFFLYNGKAMTGQAIRQGESSSQSSFWASDTTGECSLQPWRENSGCCFHLKIKHDKGNGWGRSHSRRTQYRAKGLESLQTAWTQLGTYQSQLQTAPKPRAGIPRASAHRKLPTESKLTNLSTCYFMTYILSTTGCSQDL